MAGLSLSTATWQVMHVFTGGNEILLLPAGFSWHCVHCRPKPTWSLWLKGIGCSGGGCGATFAGTVKTTCEADCCDFPESFSAVAVRPAGAGVVSWPST